MYEYVLSGSRLREAAHFIARHATEIAPLFDPTEELPLKVLRAVAHPEFSWEADTDLPTVPKETGVWPEEAALGVQHLIDRFRTKLFVRGNPGVTRGKRVLLTVNDPGAWNAVHPLVAKLANDRRCARIVVVASGIAGKRFREEERELYRFIEVSGGGFVLPFSTAALSFSPPSFDAILASVSARNGPEGMMLYGGKSMFGAKKLFFMAEAWGGLGSAFGATSANMDPLDGVFCNDELAAEMIRGQIPDPHVPILPTGTPILDNLEAAHAERYRREAREALGLSPSTFAFLYLGDVSGDYASFDCGSSPSINRDTFHFTLCALCAIANTHPHRRFTVLLRPHPRERDPQTGKSELWEVVKEFTLPPNLSVKSAAAPLSMNGAAYASDAIASIMSTENMLAPLRGRPGIFLGYENDGLGGTALRKTWGERALARIVERPGLTIVHDPSDLACTVADLLQNPPVLPASTAVGSAERIIEVLLRD